MVGINVSVDLRRWQNGKTMTAPVRFIILILLVIVAAVALMAPRLDERLAMMRDDNKQAEIIALLEPGWTATG
jgi:hypothetical protein